MGQVTSYYWKGLKYYLRQWKLWGLGIIISFIPILNVVTIGYGLRIIENVYENKPKLPRWKNWGTLFGTGLVFGLLLLLISSPLIALFFAYPPQEGTFAFISWVSELPAVLSIAAILFLIFLAYLHPALFAIFAIKQNPFLLKKIVGLAFSKDYLQMWVFLFVVVVLTEAITYIPLIGDPFSLYFRMLVGSILLGLLLKKMASDKSLSL